MGVSFVRTIIVFFSLVMSLRIMGKRQLGELEPLELVVAILISNLASQPLADVGTPLIYGLVPILTLLACQLLISRLTVRSIKFRALVCGTPSVLIEKGVLREEQMRKDRVSIDELMAELRKFQVTDISTVRRAVLETDGSLSVTLFAPYSPVTPEQMGLAVQDTGCPVIVVSDGRLMEKNLKASGHNNDWLTKELKGRKIPGIDSVFLMTVDEAGGVYVSMKEADE